jgi:hypothetical protein
MLISVRRGILFALLTEGFCASQAFVVPADLDSAACLDRVASNS